MQRPDQARREAASTPTTPHTPHLSRRSRAALGLVSRLAVLLTVVLALVLPLDSSQSVAFATHTSTTPTPTPTPTPTLPPWPRGGSQLEIATPTPTLSGYGPYQPAQGQTQYAGSPGQQSVSSPSYPADQNSGVAPLPSGVSAGAIVSGAGSPGPGGSDACYGDELITYSPQAPRIGNELLIAVTSAHPHPYGRLAGTEPTRFIRERPGQRGYVWEWTVQPTYPGQHEYTFYVDSTIPCQKIQLRVLQSLATATPKPPTPYGWDNGNENLNGNSNDNTNTDAFIYPNYPTSGSAYAPVIDPSYYVMPSQDVYACSSFASQANAQAVLRADPTDPNRLDTNPRDGLACGGVEAQADGVPSGMMSAPFDGTRVPRP